MEESNKGDFPVAALCPKKETGVTNFLIKNPQFDGRGTIIAIFDTGVDPGAPGMQVTSDGKPKVIERYDCSGAGDVDTSTVVKANDGLITGLTGRKLKIPQKWTNPTGDFHIGAKCSSDLYPSKVKERVDARRKEANWDNVHRVSAAEANRKLYKDQTQNGNKTNDLLTPLEKLAKEDAEAYVDVLTSLEKKYKDHGPVLDCVVFHDGTSWVVCLSADGDLENGIQLREYKICQEFTKLSNYDMMNVSVNVWDEGNRLEIVGMCGSHGTHVACIASANFPNDPQNNGVAPGAQIVSLTIGDGRLGSMETGTAIVRAMAVIMQNSHRIQIINMSYGEHSGYANNGRLGELMKEVIDKHGVTWLVSAGNQGPVLSTVGSPPWISSNNMIGIGAFVTPEMMAAEYSLRDKLPGMSYTWSSRGPTIDGELGVSVCAPGGAITSVPNFCLRNAQLMNGTSMAAPHVAGCVALILSGAIQKGFEWSPYSVKKSLELGAIPPSNYEPFGQGYGLVQVEQTFKTLEMLSNTKERDIRFSVAVAGGNAACPMKGIYIRDPPFEKVKEYTVSVEPVFFKDDSKDEDLIEKFNKLKIDFRMNLILALSPGVSWISIPQYFDLANLQRNFSVKVYYENLQPGVHFAKVEAYDANDMSKGPVFTVPVTAIKAMKPEMTSSIRPNLELPTALHEPGTIKRYFVHVPIGAKWASLKLKSTGGDNYSSNELNTSRFVIQCMSIVPGASCKEDEFYKVVTLVSMEENVLSFRVTEGRVMEVCISRWWAEPNEIIQLQSSICFRGLTMNRPEIVLAGGDVCQKVTIHNNFAHEEIQPQASLKYQVQLLRANDMKVLSLSSPRDMLPDGRIIYELQSTYTFSLSRGADITVSCPLLDNTLYESEYESQLWSIFDHNKRYICSGDAYHKKWNAKLEKGEYTMKLHVRHDKRESLDRFMNLSNGSLASSNWNGESQIPSFPVLLSMKLSSPISLEVYQTYYDLQDFKPSKKSSWSATLKRDTTENAFVYSFIPDKSLKGLPGSSTTYFSGIFTVGKDETAKKFTTCPLRLIVPEAPGKAKSSTKDEKKKNKEEMMDQLRDLKVSWVSKLDLDESKKVYDELLIEHPNHFQASIARLAALEAATKPSEDSDNEVTSNKVEIYEEILSVCDRVIDQIERGSLLTYFGTKSSASSTELGASKVKQSMEKQKTALVEALVKKGIALIELSKLKQEGIDDSTLEIVDELIFEVQKFVELSDPKVIEFTLLHSILRGFHARAMKLILKAMESEPGKVNFDSFDKPLLGLAENLGWSHLVWLIETNKAAKYPKDFRPF